MTTATHNPTDVADIRRRIARLARALCAGDLETVMSIYTANVVSFDIEPPCSTSEWKQNDQRFWVRATMCLRKINGDWFIAHDQVSVPLDLATGAALVTLEP